MEHFKRLSVLFLVAAVALVGSFASSVPKVFAATGGGTATIGKDGGAQGAGVSVEQSTSHVFAVVLTIPGAGMTLGAASPTFTIPTGFTAPNLHSVATAGDVNADGKWSVVASGCTVDSSPSSLTTVASGQVITVDITADCAVGNTITLTYQGTSAVTMGATALTVSTADAGDPGPVTPLIAGSPTITVTDTTAPTVVVTMDDSALNIGDTALVTFTFSEAPTEFAAADVTVGSGSIGAIDASNPLIQTATYTPTNGVEDAINVITVGTAWTDAALNAGVGDDSPNYTVDTIAPSVAVTMSDAVLTVGETAVVTLTFSEAPTGFDATDVNLTNANGTIGAIDAGNPLIQTATFTPTNDITDVTNVITVGTAWTDAALNAGVGDDSPNYTVNTTAAASSGESPQPGMITVIKTVINDNGGTKTVADFLLFVNGASVVSGVTNVFSTPAPVYTATETSSLNYVRTFSGACDSNGRLNLNSGDLKICTITNDDKGAPAVPPVPPLIDVVKTASPLALPGGSGPVTYTYTLKNIGTVPVTDITMGGDTCSPIVLASGDTTADKKLQVNETWVYRCSTTLSATHTNVVTTTGWANGISAVDIASATVVVGASVVPPLIHVTKVPSPLTLLAGGGAVTYTEKISNPGTVALSDVSIADDKCSPVTYVSGDTNGNSKLEATETWTYTCRANLTRSTTNTVTVSGDANGLTARDYAIATVLVAAPSLPEAGFPPREKSNPWNAVVLLIIFAVLFSYITQRKQIR